MLRAFFKPQVNLTTTDLGWDFLYNRDYHRTLLISQGFAVFWWLVAQLLDGATVLWNEQIDTFMESTRHVMQPYTVDGFVNPPWTPVLLLPFGGLPIRLSVLIQLGIYFALITTLVYRFGGNRRAALLALTSFWALDAAIEINLEWLVCLGLVLPPALSGPFIAIKPQLALGYWLSLTPRQLIIALEVMAAVLLLSLAIWGSWLPEMYDAVQRYSTGHDFNMAPLVLMPAPLALLIGAYLMWQGYRRKSAFLTIWGWVFFVPYITFYSLLIHYALFAVAYPRLAALITGVMWLIYGGALVIYFVGKAI